MLYKRCIHCGKQLPISKNCECQIEIERQRNKKYGKPKLNKEKSKEYYKKYDRLNRNKEAAEFYNSTKWRNLRKYVKEYYNGIDIYLFYKHNKLEDGYIVHHIVPVREDKTKRLRLDNLILLTEQSHQEIHKRMDNGETEEVVKELNDYRIKFINDYKR